VIEHISNCFNFAFLRENNDMDLIVRGDRRDDAAPHPMWAAFAMPDFIGGKARLVPGSRCPAGGPASLALARMPAHAD
jgi:hypothetical protein